MVLTYLHCRRLHGPLGGQSLLVPFEVWHHIASFVSPAELRNLYSVNPAFLDAAFNARYAHVHLSNDFGQLSRMLARLRDPFIRSRIRSLRIKPWQIPDDPAERSSLRLRLKVGIRRLMDPDFPEFYEKQQLQQRVQKDIKTVMDTISAFTHSIHEYFVDWDEQPYHPLFFSSFLLPFLRLATGLRKLTLKVPTDRYLALFPTRLSPGLSPLRALEELHITLSTGYTPRADLDSHLDCLAVFIHNTFTTLKSLSITTTKTSMYLDLSHFFAILGGASELRHFSLSIPLGCNHLSDPSKLRLVLSNHRDTLRSLTLITPVTEAGQAIPQDAVGWVVDSIRGVAFPELQALHLTIWGNSQCLCPVLNCLSSCATTLSSLLLDGRALPDDDVASLFNYIPPSSGIRRLRITAKTLSVQLMDLAFTKLSRLEDVEITFKRLAGQRGETAFFDFRHYLLYDVVYADSPVRRLRLETLRNATSLPPLAKNRLHPAFEHCLPKLEEFLSDTLPQ